MHKQFLNFAEMTVLDIGGSGVKTAKLTTSNLDTDCADIIVTHFSEPNWQHFTDWMHTNGLLKLPLIGISCAGFVNKQGLIGRSHVTGWDNFPLRDVIQKYATHSRVFVLNDAEAHLMAHADLYAHPMMCISLGTSLGFAITDESGQLVRLADGFNFDLGDMTIATRASNNRVWWALGSMGLQELQHNLGEAKGTQLFGSRLGAYLAMLCGVFRPKTIVLSGGISADCGHQFHETMMNEFRSYTLGYPKNTVVNIYLSPYGANAALVGIANFIRLHL